jgi:type I restriction enzyme, S subunit
MSFPRYPAYKPSGVEWLGEVPEHWGAIEARREITLLTSGSRGWAEYYSDEGPIFLRIGNLTRDSIRLNLEDIQRVTPPAGVEGDRTEVNEGDVLFSITAYLGSVAVVPGGLERAYVSQHVCLARLASGNLMPDWLAYSVLSASGKAYLEAESYGGTKVQLALDDVKSFPLSLPSIKEQRSLITFLDHETGKIDALIAEQQRLIELLQEKRQAVISHAVTKGLNPDAPMKDSGVVWLGEVPEHWEVTALKRLCRRITDGAHISPETDNGVYCFVSTRDISESDIDFEGCLRTSEASYEYLLRTGCQPEVGDVLFSKDGTIGRTLVVREQHDFVVASSLIIIRPDTNLLDAEFLDVLCKSDAVQNQVESFVKGAGLPRLSIANLMRVIGIFPPLQEQRRIANVVSKISVRFTALMAEAEAAVTLLQERRSALISAAVTGQIDVRGLAEAKAGEQ